MAHGPSPQKAALLRRGHQSRHRRLAGRRPSRRRRLASRRYISKGTEMATVTAGPQAVHGLSAGPQAATRGPTAIPPAVHGRAAGPQAALGPTAGPHANQGGAAGLIAGHSHAAGPHTERGLAAGPPDLTASPNAELILAADPRASLTWPCRP